MMTLPLFFDLTYEVVTPLFLAGSDQTHAELRAPSIRGAARAWYRAIDPNFLAKEAQTFGAAFDDEDRDGSVQSPFLVQVLQAPQRADFTLDRNAYRRFDHGNPPNKTNGVLYTGYTLLERFNVRRAFSPGTTFTVRLLFPRPAPYNDLLYQRVLGAFWTLGHLGALGSRANRCWGSVSLTALTAGPTKRLPPEVKPLLTRFQPAAVTSAEKWKDGVAKVLKDLSDELGKQRAGHAAAAPHLGHGARILVSKSTHRTWEAAVNEIGANLQAFRRTRGDADRHDTVRALLHAQGDPGGAPLPHALQRTAFGLPYTMRYGIVPTWLKNKGIRFTYNTIIFNPRTGRNGVDANAPERHASSLRLRIVRLNDGYHPVIVRLAGDPVGSLPRKSDPERPPVVSISGGIDGANPRYTDPKPRAFPSDGLLDDFLQQLGNVLNLPVPQ